MDKRIKLLTTSLLAVGLLAACSTESTEPKVVDSGKEQTAEKESVTDKVFAVGETVDLDGNRLTVTKVEKNPGGEFDSIKAGNELVVVHLLIENNSKETYAYSEWDFKMKNSQGQITDVTYSMINEDTELTGGELAEGGKVEGTILFEQPINDAGLELQYEPDLFSDDVIKISIK